MDQYANPIAKWIEEDEGKKKAFFLGPPSFLVKIERSTAIDRLGSSERIKEDYPACFVRDPCTLIPVSSLLQGRI